MADPIVFIPLVTSAGEEAALRASNDGLELQLTHVSFGTAAYEPNGSEVALREEVKRVGISGGSRVSSDQIRMLSVWKDDPLDPAGNSASIFEVGFWAGDVLFSIWSRDADQPMGFKTPGVDFVLFNDLVFSQVPADSISVLVDPDGSAALAALSAHESALNAHPQYLLVRDVVQRSGPLAWCGLAAGTANELTLTLVDSNAELVSYAAGQRFQFIGTALNTGAVVVNIEGLGQVALKKAGDTGLVDLASGDIKPGAIFDLNYDGTVFQLGGGVGGGGGDGGAGENFEKFAYTASVAQAEFSATYVPGSLLVVQNGRVLDESDYIATNGTSVTLKTPAALDDSVIILSFRPFSVSSAYTKAEQNALMALHGGLPVGFMAPMPVNFVPPGWLELDGSVKSKTVYPDLFARLGNKFNDGTEAEGFFRLPDSRAEFLRGWDHGRGVDLGRDIGTTQDFQNAEHNHVGRTGTSGGHSHGFSYFSPASTGQPGSATGNGFTNTSRSATTNSGGSHSHDIEIDVSGGAEARPRNLSVMWCIKAFAAPSNQGMIDVAALAALCNQATETQNGTARIATDGQMLADSDNVIVTPKKLRKGFSFSFATNGHIALPSWLGGLVIQWGEVASTGSDMDISFPVAFPTICRQVVASPIGAVTSTQLLSCAVVSVAKTTFSIRPRMVASGGTVSVATQGIRYIAIGN